MSLLVSKTIFGLSIPETNWPAWLVSVANASQAYIAHPPWDSVYGQSHTMNHNNCLKEWMISCHCVTPCLSPVSFTGINGAYSGKKVYLLLLGKRLY